MPDTTSNTFEIAEQVRRFEDTSISPEMVEIYRQKTSSERLQIGFGMWRAAQKLTEAGVRSQHPDWSNESVTREVARRLSHGLV